MDDRFAADVFPDATYGICKLHSPVGIIRLVGDDGLPAPNGVCQMCHLEAHDATFFTCPTHGINPKAAGQGGCPVAGCLGESVGPTQEEIDREAESIGRVWPGGPPKLQDALAPPSAGSAGLSAGGALTGALVDAGPVPQLDAARAVEPAPAPGASTSTPTPRFDHQPARVPAPPPTERVESGGWVDPFLVGEP